MRQLHVTLNAFLVVFLLSCSTQKETINKAAENTLPSTQYQGSDTIAVKKAPRQFMPEKKWEMLHLNLDITPDFNAFELLGITELTLHPFAYTQNNLKLNAQHLRIDSLKITCKTLPNLKFEFTQLDTTKLHFNFAQPIQTTDTLQIKVYYQTNYFTATNAQKGYYFVGPKNSDSLHFYTQGEPQDNSLWFPCIDEPNQRSTHKLQVTRPEEFKSFSNGEFQFLLLNGDGTETDYYEMNQAQAPYLITLSVGNYALTNDTIKINNTEVELNYFVQKQYAPFTKPYFERTAEMIPYYSKLYGYNFPWPNYKQVIVEDFTAGAMENTTAVVFYNYLKNYIQKDSTLADNDDNIVAHELVHHWFGDLVTCKSWGQLAMNESFATFGELEWTLASKGLREYLAELSYTRAAYFYESKTLQTPIIRSSFNHPDELFNSHSYAKGGLVLNLLKQELDSAVYYKGIQNYLHTHKYSEVEIHDFRRALERTSGKDLSTFFNQWFLTKGHPIITVNQTLDSNQLTLQITQKHSRNLGPYSFTLPVVLCYEKMNDTLYISISEKTTAVKVQTKAPLKSIWVDPKESIPAVLHHQKPKNYLLTDLTSQKSTPSIYLNALNHLSEDSTITKTELAELALQGLKKHFTEHEASEFLYWILEHSAKTIATENFLLENLDASKPYSLRYIALHSLNELYGAQYFENYKALINDKNYDVSALAISLVEDSLKNEISKLIEPISPLATLEYVNQLSRTYSKYGSAENLDFFIHFKNELLKGSPEEFLGNYALFLLNTNLTEQQFNIGMNDYLSCIKPQLSWWAELIALDTANSIRFALQKNEEPIHDLSQAKRNEYIAIIEATMNGLIKQSKHTEVQNYQLD